MFEKLKELSKDTAVYGISTILGRFLSFLLVPFYTNVFTTAEYGIFTYLYTILAFMNIVYIYGMDVAFLKYGSLAEERNQKDYFSTPYLMVFFTSLIATVILYFNKDSLNIFLDIPASYSSLIVYLILILFFDTLSLIPFANLRLKRKSGKFAAIKIVNILINLALNLILILKYHYGIEAVFISNLVASVFSFIALLPEILKLLVLRIDKRIFRQMLKFGIPYLPASIAAMMVQMIDVPILRELTNDSTVGIYRANYKLGIFMMLFVSMFQYAWQPFFLNNAREENAKELFSKVLTFFVVAASIIWAFVTLFIKDLASIEILHGRTLIGKEFLSGIYIVPVVLLAYLFYGMYVNFTAGIYIEEKTKYMPYITGAGALVNVGMNFWLIPLWGYWGAALATLASYLVMAGGLFITVQKFYKIHYEYEKIFLNLLLIGITMFFYFWLARKGKLSLEFELLLFMAFVVSIFLFKIVEPREVKRLLKNYGK